LLILGSENWRP